MPQILNTLLRNFFFFKLGVNFLRTVTLIDNHVTTAYNNINNVTMSLHTHMQNVTADIKFLAYEHTLAISKFKVLGKVSL